MSSGRLTASGLQPQFFEGKRHDADPRRARADFDWLAKQLTLTRDGRTDTLTLPPATQDLLSTMYQFMFIELEQLQRFELSMTNGRKLDHFLYTINRGVEIDTPIGRMTTIHLVKRHRPDESGTEIWIAPQHRNLPVKMLILEEDGARYEQVITKLEIKSPNMMKHTSFTFYNHIIYLPPQGFPPPTFPLSTILARNARAFHIMLTGSSP